MTGRCVTAVQVVRYSAMTPEREARPPNTDGVYDENGVDRTLVRASLRETPLERLEALEDMNSLAESVKRAE